MVLVTSLELKNKVALSFVFSSFSMHVHCKQVTTRSSVAELISHSNEATPSSKKAQAHLLPTCQILLPLKAGFAVSGLQTG